MCTQQTHAHAHISVVGDGVCDRFARWCLASTNPTRNTRVDSDHTYAQERVIYNISGLRASEIDFVCRRRGGERIRGGGGVKTTVVCAVVDREEKEIIRNNYGTAAAVFFFFFHFNSDISETLSE